MRRQDFKFLISLVDMPKEYEQYRLQLIIEYCRLLVCGKAVGMIDVPQSPDVAMRLGMNAVDVANVISRIGALLQRFSDIHPDETAIGQNTIGANTVIDALSLVMAYETTKEERKHLRRHRLIQYISRRATTVGDIPSHPSRVQWAAVDTGAFEALLQDLHKQTERIHEMIGSDRADEIHDITAKTYRELVAVHNGVKELNNMFHAVTRMIGETSIARRNENEETLRDLLRLKAINHISDQILSLKDDFDVQNGLNSLISVTKYDAITVTDHLSYAPAEGAKDPSTLHRPRGALTKDGANFEVWIEWRLMHYMAEGSVHLRESRLRIVTLAQMLHESRPRHLYSPQCIGYIDDSKRNSRYGLIFKMPDGSDSKTTLKSLYDILGERSYKPTLAQRMSLARKLATSLLHLHATDWIHKAINSDNIVFPFSGEAFDLEEPILSGFEYGRPLTDSVSFRRCASTWNIYKWPGIQNEVPIAANSRKTHDIYSLGLVLLEIAHWRPLDKLICLKRWPEPSSQDARIRAWLLEEDGYPPFKDANPLLQLKDTEKYWRVVRRCLVAHGESGMRVAEGRDQSESSGIGIEIQKAFTERVVEELKGISI